MRENKLQISYSTELKHLGHTLLFYTSQKILVYVCNKVSMKNGQFKVFLGW